MSVCFRHRAFLTLACALSSVVLVGCASYRWTSDVPQKMRTVSVPTFRNESDVQGLGSAMARQVLREFQREGTFSIKTAGDAALEIQGIVKGASASSSGYDRHSGMRFASYDLTAVVEVSVIDKVNGRVLLDNREYTATTTFISGQDYSTAMRDSAGRLSDDLARQVVDDVLNLKW